jgi:TorA maturation chaperone TorD
MNEPMVTATPRTLPACPSRQAALLDRADLLFCLARCFQPPPPDWSVEDFAQALSPDLTELGTALALPMTPVQQALDAEVVRWRHLAATSEGDADLWLVEYTRLFLMPPVLVPLNTGLYLEGTLGGEAAQMMHACYQTAGVTPDEAFRDLPDHAAMQMEFLARLLERAARGDVDAEAMAQEFADEFVHAWAEPLQQACAAATGRFPAAHVFHALTGLLRVALGAPHGRA